MVDIEHTDQIELFSTHSTQVSLLTIHNTGKGLDQHRTNLLSRTPEIGDWARFKVNTLEMHDLAYLTALTGHEFAILRGKREDILFHGNSKQCMFDDVLVEMLMSHKLEIFGHSHPGEESPVASAEDRDALKAIGQKESRIISGYSGKEILFSSDPFDII